MANIYSNISVGSSGLYTVSSPFDVLINNQLEYTCIAIEDIAGIISRGGDPLNELYIPFGLDKNRFETDSDSSIPIFTLQSSKGEILTIPGFNITGAPNNSGIKYRNIMLGISLSAIPESYDLTVIKSEVADLIHARIGLKSEVKSVEFGKPSIITVADSKKIEAARLLRITKNDSNTFKIKKLTDQNKALMNQLKQLETYILSKL